MLEGDYLSADLGVRISTVTITDATTKAAVVKRMLQVKHFAISHYNHSFLRVRR